MTVKRLHKSRKCIHVSCLNLRFMQMWRHDMLEEIWNLNFFHGVLTIYRTAFMIFCFTLRLTCFLLSRISPQVAAISWSWHWRPLRHAPFGHRNESGDHPSYRQVPGQVASQGHRWTSAFLGLAFQRPTPIHCLCEVWRGQVAAGWSRGARRVPHHTSG